jgi:predicted metal-binding membrane protein
MDGMSMPQQSWSSAAASYLGMWLAMMVPMMLPSLLPVLARYRRSVRGAEGLQLHGLTALMSLGYFVVWAMLGLVALAVSDALAAADLRWGAGAGHLPFAAGSVLLAAGVVQLSPWKSRQLVRCREASSCGGRRGPDALGAWREGLRHGVRCALCCSGLMLALLALGLMNPVAMVLVTLAITAERLAPAPAVVARAAGLTIVMAGVLAVTRI